MSDLDLQEKHLGHLLDAIGAQGPDGWTPVIDLQPLFFRLTLDSATEFLFGHSVESQVIALSQSTSRVLHGGVDEETFAECFDEVCILSPLRSSESAYTSRAILTFTSFS